MSTQSLPPSPDKELEDWIDFCAQLGPQQNLALIGLLAIDPTLAVGDIDPARIVGEIKCRSSENWATLHFRKALRVYCQVNTSFLLGVGLNGLTKIPGPVWAGLGLTIGGWVGFCAWGLGYGLNQWCSLYGPVSYGGPGRYWGDIPQDERFGKFSITYEPAISSVVKDSSTVLDVHKIHVYVPARTKGLFDSALNSKDAVDICKSLRGEAIHVFEFRDSISGKTISGGIDEVCPDVNHPNFLSFLESPSSLEVK